MLLKEIEQEAQTTRSMLSGIPDDKFSWKHEPANLNITTELLELFERSLAEGKKHPARAAEDDLIS